MSTTKRHKKFLGLFRRNEKGQVAIFVALIFQIVFILFALMINVGLLVHHKINLQQSTDLAAYYGAMKQAEVLNVVSHVNFQIRQAFKLLTWRYRILGTFGLQHQAGATSQIDYPIEHIGPPTKKFKYNPNSESFNCTVTGSSGPLLLSPNDIPFMCMAHYGFQDYSSRPNSNETLCQANCDFFNGVPKYIPYPGSLAHGNDGGNSVPVINNYNGYLQQVQLNLQANCNLAGPMTIAQMAKFYLSYLQDVNNKKLFIKMMLANLSAAEKDMLDLEGRKVIDGVTATFKNNLTEANNSSMKDNTFETLNSLSPTYGHDCNYSRVTDNQKYNDSSVGLFAEINFKFIQYYMLKCTIQSGTNPLKFSPLSVYTTGAGAPELDPDLIKQITDVVGMGADTANKIKAIMERNDSDHSVGIEKNPWCGVYYGVKATSTPTIPFLPISKITLHASAFAQPFGGSVGPRAFKEWIPTANRSDSTGGDTARTDQNLPLIDPSSSTFTSVVDNRKILLNYSNYIGDVKGLSDPSIVAIYHDMLLNRTVANEKQDPPTSSGKASEPTRATDDGKPTNWPAYSEWNNTVEDITSTEYDPLAQGANHSNAFMRDIELSVVAPNQFDNTYYSIEPDFYNVYGKTLEKSLDTFKSQYGLSGVKLVVPKDFGNSTQPNGTVLIGGTGKNFGVRNQLEVVQHIMKEQTSAPPTLASYTPSGPYHSQGINHPNITAKYFTFIPFSPASLLASWTMKDFISDDYSKITQDDTTMPFAKCDDDATMHGNGYGSITDGADPKGGSDPLPASPGNCVTGGRTGYSVKIVGPDSLFGDRLLVGGSATGALRNPPTGFVSF